MRPDGELAILEKSKAARRRDRCVGEIAARISRFKPLLALRVAGIGRAEDAIDRWPLQQPVGFLLRRSWRLYALPGDVIDGGGAGRFDRGLVVAENGQKISIAYEFDRALGGAADRIFVDGRDGCAAV